MRHIIAYVLVGAGIGTACSSAGPSDVGPGAAAPEGGIASDGGPPGNNDGGGDPGVDGAGPAADSASSTDAPPTGNGGARPLGTVTDKGATPNCVAGATCRTLTVACPGAAPLDVNVQMQEPTVPVLGTIVVHDGGGGITFFGRGALTARYLAKGYRIVDMAWANDWEKTSMGAGSIKAGACRPATVLKWAFDNVHKGSRDQGFCAQGQSGGSGAMSYALAAYGMEDYLDYVMLTQGPPFGRMDCGCDPSAAGCASVPALCPEIANASLALPGGKIDEWAGVSSCTAGISAADVAKLAADSVASPDDDFDYPKTHVSGWYCAMRPNGTTGGGAFYLAKVQPAPKVFCSPDCEVESIYQTTATLTGGALVADQMLSEMTAECVPRHR